MEEDLRVRRLLDIPGRPDVIEVGMGQGRPRRPSACAFRGPPEFFRPRPRVDDERLPSLRTADDRTVDFEQTDRKRLNDKAVLSRSQSPSNGLKRFAERHYNKRPVPISTTKGLPSRAPRRQYTLRHAQSDHFRFQRHSRRRRRGALPHVPARSGRGRNPADAGQVLRRVPGVRRPGVFPRGLPWPRDGGSRMRISRA